jgi:deoxyribodipyrimidine photolyase-like uncharacterized protein
MARFYTPRRFYHRKRMNARFNGDRELEGHWRFKQENCTPATPMPQSIPYRDTLEAHGYSVLEDLVGADEDELVGVAELMPSEARDVLEALNVLPLDLLL